MDAIIGAQHPARGKHPVRRSHGYPAYNLLYASPSGSHISPFSLTSKHDVEEFRRGGFMLPSCSADILELAG